MVQTPLHERIVVGNGLDLARARGDATSLDTTSSNRRLGSRTDLKGRSDRMRRLTSVIAVVLIAACLNVVAYAQQPAPPPFATTKVDSTDNVYVFRYGNHQSMFVITSAGVIATDPISYGRPQAAVTYVDEIKKVSNQPIKYLIYNHQHFDHIAGGKPFKDAGATIVSHTRAK